MNQKWEDSWVKEYIDYTGWLRYDTEDSTTKENYSEYLEIQEELATYGLTLDDPCIEHDCISGNIVELIE